MSISGFLKSKGIKTYVLIANLEENLHESLQEIKPDLIGFSVLTTEHSWLEQISQEVKKNFPKIAIIVGGIHAILYSRKLLQIPAVDYVCTGEGEFTLLALCNSIKEGKDNRENIKGLGYHDGNKVRFNDGEMLIENLSSFYEDRDIYYERYPDLRNDELKQFIASRGCPYKCTFCFNQQLVEVYKSKGKYVRMKEPEHFVDEILNVKKRTIMKSIFFADDLFTINKGWLREFLPLYKEKVGIPFMCTTRANLMNEEIASLLKEAGCHTISFGIETGSEKIRNEVLKKNISNTAIVDCANILNKNGIRIQTSNMFCLPDERLNDAYETIVLNIKIRAQFVFSTIFMPFPDTDLAKYCIKKGYLPENLNFNDLPKSFLTHSILRLEDKNKIENLQRCSYFIIKYPILFDPFKVLIRSFEFKWFFLPFFFLGTFLRYKDERQISTFNAIRYLWRFRKSF